MHLLKRLSTPLLLSALSLTLASFIGSSISTTAQADEIAIPVGQQGADKASLAKPKTGMKAEAVEKKFGAPLQKSTPVGKPPISKWEYPHYYVYFESDRVIDTVLKPYSEEITAPATPAPTVIEATKTEVVEPVTEAVAPPPTPEEVVPAPEPTATEPSASEPIPEPTPEPIATPEPVVTPESAPTAAPPADDASAEVKDETVSEPKDEVDPAEKTGDVK